MRIEEAPRVRLAHLPTPVQRAGRLSAALGGAEIWIKRDDCAGGAAGGNKVRKLEFLLGRMLAEEKRVAVTFGGMQSNHARETAAACARLGVACELILVRVVPRSTDAYEQSGNVLLDEVLGAQIHVVDDEQAAAECFMDLYEQHGEAMFGIGPGGSDATGSLGYVQAAFEIAEQMPEPPGRIFVAAGSSGTAAGLLAGLGMTGIDAALHAVAVYHDAERTREDIERIARELGVATEDLGRLRVHGEWLGEGYGLPTPETVAAIDLFARTEGLVLDPVYTGKAAAAMIAMCRNGGIAAGDRVMFVHTGGLPGLFAYPELFARVP